MRTGIEQGLSEKVLSSEEVELFSFGCTFDERVEFFKKFNVGNYYDIPFGPFPPISNKTLQKMELYLDNLKKAGLDINKGSAEFGYKMPIPKKDSPIRYLRIFRRK